MNYQYHLEHGNVPATASFRETDLKVRMRLKRRALPLVPTGRETRAIEARA